MRAVDTDPGRGRGDTTVCARAIGLGRSPVRVYADEGGGGPEAAPARARDAAKAESSVAASTVSIHPVTRTRWGVGVGGA